MGQQRRIYHDQVAMFHVKLCEGGLYRRRGTMVFDGYACMPDSARSDDSVSRET